MNLAQADFLIAKTYYHVGQETSCHFERGENERMLSETLIDGLKRYEIGSKIRTLRLGKKLGLVQLRRVCKGVQVWIAAPIAPM